MMKGDKGFAELDLICQENNYNILVMNLLGPNLEKLYKYCENKFSMKTILMLGVEMLERIECLHSKGLIHRDIKPENFVVGSQDNIKTVFVIDFGLAR